MTPSRFRWSRQRVLIALTCLFVLYHFSAESTLRSSEENREQHALAFIHCDKEQDDEWSEWHLTSTESFVLEHPSTVDFLTRRNATVSEFRRERRMVNRPRTQAKYTNATGKRIFEMIDVGDSNLFFECGSVERRTCPIFEQNSHVAEKNWYAPTRTAQQVARGLCENARMLHLIQELSQVPIVVMYGSLIGQWWNQQSLPWDTDIDVHVLDAEKFEHWLMGQPRTQFHRHEYVNGRANTENVQYYKLPDANFTIYFDRNEGHHIEYRLIHVPTGVYTDMMTLKLTNDTAILARDVQSKPLNVKTPAFAMKSSFNKLWGGNILNTEDMLPLRPCELNEASLWCPQNVTAVLRQKYPHFDDNAWHRRQKQSLFNTTSRCWERAT